MTFVSSFFVLSSVLRGKNSFSSNCCFCLCRKKRSKEKKNSSRLDQKLSGTGDLSLLPTVFTDTQQKLRAWLEYVEQSLLKDKIRISDINSILSKKKIYKDLLDQTFEQEHNLEVLNEIAREYYSKVTIDVSRHIQSELTNYHDRLSDVKMFLSECLTKYNRLEKTLTEFEVKKNEFCLKSIDRRMFVCFFV